MTQEGKLENGRAAAGSGRSIHIGLNFVDPAHYAGWNGELAACEFDAEDMRAIAEAQGFKAISLIREAATRYAVTAALLDAAANLVAGDMLLVSYSGHGGQVPDTSGDEDDGNDETWCLYDGQLIDDELFEIWKHFSAGVRVHVISDSCHSGSVVRYMNGAMVVLDAGEAQDDPRARPRVMPRAIAGRTYRNNRSFYDGLQKGLQKLGWDKPGHEKALDLQCTVRLFSGCTDAQFSYDGIANGRFTEQLLKIWSEGRFKGDQQAFYKAVLATMPDNQTPQHMVIGSPDEAWDRMKPFTR